MAAQQADVRLPVVRRLVGVRGQHLSQGHVLAEHLPIQPQQLASCPRLEHMEQRLGRCRLLQDGPLSLLLFGLHSCELAPLQANRPVEQLLHVSGGPLAELVGVRVEARNLHHRHLQQACTPVDHRPLGAFEHGQQCGGDPLRGIVLAQESLHLRLHCCGAQPQVLLREPLGCVVDFLRAVHLRRPVWGVVHRLPLAEHLGALEHVPHRLRGGRCKGGTHAALLHLARNDGKLPCRGRRIVVRDTPGCVQAPHPAQVLRHDAVHREPLVRQLHPRERLHIRHVVTVGVLQQQVLRLVVPCTDASLEVLQRLHRERVARPELLHHRRDSRLGVPVIHLGGVRLQGLAQERQHVLVELPVHNADRAGIAILVDAGADGVHTHTQCSPLIPVQQDAGQVGQLVAIVVCTHRLSWAERDLNHSIAPAQGRVRGAPARVLHAHLRHQQLEGTDVVHGIPEVHHRHRACLSGVRRVNHLPRVREVLVELLDDLLLQRLRGARRIERRLRDLQRLVDVIGRVEQRLHVRSPRSVRLDLRQLCPVPQAIHLALEHLGQGVEAGDLRVIRDIRVRQRHDVAAILGAQSVLQLFGPLIGFSRCAHLQRSHRLHCSSPCFLHQLLRRLLRCLVRQRVRGFEVSLLLLRHPLPGLRGQFTACRRRNHHRLIHPSGLS